MVVNKEQFLLILEDIKSCIFHDDSFEGNISYEVLDKDKYSLTGCYRIGNYMGQGGIRSFNFE